MIVPEQCRSLIAEIIFIVEGISLDHKKAAFDKIKRKMLRDQIKRLHKNNFESVNTNSETSSSNAMLSNYVSVSDFKPLEANYSSIKIIDYATHGIRKDINEDVARKIQYTSTQLLNKSTFLEQWMIRQPSPDLKPEKYPLSDYALKKISTYNEEALTSVRRFTFSHFCKFNIKKKQGFFSLGQSDPLKYKKTQISTSLTFLKDSEEETAIEAFEILLRAGGDTTTKHNYLYEINELIELMMSGMDTLKEQIFLQIIKQVSSKKQVYLRILCAVCYCVKPSTRIYIPLLNYLYEQSTLYEYFPKHLLNYCFFHLIRNFDKERQASPCLFELFCAYHATKIPVTVGFPREKVFFIESYTTVQELLGQIIQYYNLDSHIEYLLEVNGYLMEKGNLLDRLNFYCEIEDEDDFKWKDYQQFQGLKALVVLKNVNDASYSPRCHSIMYNYCANQYTRGMYSLKSTEVVMIGALKMISEMENNEQFYTFEFANLISRRKLRGLNQSQKDNYRKHILKNYYKLAHLSRVESRKSILQILSKNKGFNTHFFRSEIFVDEYDQLVAWVGLQKERFIIVEPSTGRVMRTIPYSRIKEWGKSKSQLCLRVDGVGQFHIESRQVEVMCSVFENYINYYSTLLNSIK